MMITLLYSICFEAFSKNLTYVQTINNITVIFLAIYRVWVDVCVCVAVTEYVRLGNLLTEMY